MDELVAVGQLAPMVGTAKTLRFFGEGDGGMVVVLTGQNPSLPLFGVEDMLGATKALRFLKGDGEVVVSVVLISLSLLGGEDAVLGVVSGTGGCEAANAPESKMLVLGRCGGEAAADADEAAGV